MKGALNTQEGQQLRTTSQKRRAALQGQSVTQQSTVTKQSEMECSIDLGGKLTPASTVPSARNQESAPNKKTMREGIQALRGSEKVSPQSLLMGGVTSTNVGGGATSASDNPNYEETTTTHEDRKISNISEMPFGENFGSSSIAEAACISSADNQTAKFGKVSPAFSGTQGAVVTVDINSDLIGTLTPHNFNPKALGTFLQTEGLASQAKCIGGPPSTASVCGSASSLQPHPFNVLIAEFQHKRQTAGTNSSLRKQATVFEFLTSLKKNIRELDQQYYVYKKLRRQEAQQLYGTGLSQGLGENGVINVQQQTPLTQQMSFGNEQKPQNQPTAKQLGLTDCQEATEGARKGSNCFMGQGENDENSSELANTGGANPNLGASHIFGQFVAEIGGFNGFNNQSIYQPHHHFEPFSSFEFQPNLLQHFYPKQVQRQLHKKKYSHSEKIIHGLKAPNQHVGKGQNLGGLTKHAMKLKALGECQMQMMRIILQRIDRKSRPIRKQERIVSDNLKRRNVQLDEENPFDIIQLIQSSYSHKAAVQQLQQQQMLPASSFLQGYQSCANEDSRQTPKIKLQEVPITSKPSSVNQKGRKVVDNPEEEESLLTLTVKNTDGRGRSPSIVAQSPNFKGKVDNINLELTIQSKVEPHTEPHPKQGKKTSQRLSKERGSVSIRKLRLTKSQSVALPLSGQDAEMRDDEEKTYVMQTDMTSENVPESNKKSAIKKPLKVSFQKLREELEQPVVETVQKENGSFSFKIKIPNLVTQVPQEDITLMLPLQLIKSKSYTPAATIQRKKMGKRTAHTKGYGGHEITSITPNHGHQSYYEPMGPEDKYMQPNQPQYECECMLTQHNHHEHNVQINNYFLYGDASGGQIEEEEVCTCCQGNDGQHPQTIEGMHMPSQMDKQRFGYGRQMSGQGQTLTQGVEQPKYDNYITSGGRLNIYSQSHTVASTHLNHSVNRDIMAHDYQRVPLGQIAGKCSRTIDFFDYGNDIDVDGQNHIQGSLGLTNFFNNDPHHHLGITPEIPSVGKELGKLSFFGMDPPARSSSTDMIGGAQPLRQESPDPHGTTVRMINNQPMMIVDSATPMFTSEFTINGGPGLYVGGLEIPSLNHHHHSMINEWNPINILEPHNSHGAVGGQQGLLLHHSHSHDSCWGLTMGGHLHGNSSGSHMNNQGNIFDLRLV